MNEVRKFLRGKKIKHFFISEVTKYNKKPMNGHVVLTQTSLLVVNSGRKIELERAWFDITSVEIDNDDVVIRAGRKCTSIVCLEQARVVGEITCYLHMILSELEFEKLKIPKFEGAFPNSSAECELYKLSMCSNIPPKVLNAVAYRETTLEIESGWKRVAKLFPKVINCLSLTKRISELQVELTRPEDAWSLLLRNNSMLEHIESFVVSNVCENTVTFALERKSGMSLSIREKCDFRNLYRLLETGKVNGLSLLGEIDERDLYNLVNSSHFHKLRYFRATQLPKLNFIEYANKFSNLYALSLPNAGLFIGNVFELLSMAECPNLRGIDLSGNVGRGFINPQILLPRKLFKIHLNSVHWDVRSLIDFFKLTEKHQTDFLLSMADSEISDTEHNMESIFALMRNITCCHLCGLTWDRNIVTSDFFLFIAGFTKLSRLSLSGSVNESNFQFLVEFMRQNELIRVLDLSGSKLINVKKLLKHLHEFRDVRVLNISDCGIGDEHVDLLAENLIANGTVREIVMDKSSISSLETWRSFVGKMERGNSSFTISYPVKDMERFDVASTSPEAKELARALYQLRNRKKVEIRQHLIEVSISDYSDRFPTHLSNGQIGQIDEMTEIVDVPSVVESVESKSIVRRKRHRRAMSVIAKKPPVTGIRPKRVRIEPPPQPQITWKIPVFNLPEIDNSEIVDTQNNEFAIHRLLKLMTQDEC